MPAQANLSQFSKRQATYVRVGATFRHVTLKYGNGPGNELAHAWSCINILSVHMLRVFSGAKVRRVLKILDVLDGHTFYSCRAHNPLTTLYCSVSAAQCSFEVPLTDEMLTMLLCQWAVTPYRSGEHRPLVVAMLLRQRQEDILKVLVLSKIFLRRNVRMCLGGVKHASKLLSSTYYMLCCVHCTVCTSSCVFLHA